jgi:hypothetical protein
MNDLGGLRAPARARTTKAAIAAIALLAVLAAAATAGAKNPAHPFIPGSVVIGETTYPANGNPAIQLGQPLPGILDSNGNPIDAVADGKYPEVFNNDGTDPSFAVSTPVTLVDADSSGNQLLQIKVPTDQITTSFSSKSEGALNFSTNGQDLSFLGYNAAPNALDASNSDTPLVRDPTNPDQQGPYNRVAADLDSSGNWTFTDSNAYSGDNGRAVILNNATGTFYAAGNSNNGSSVTTANPGPNDITNSGGAQAFAQSFASQADQAPGAPVSRLGNFTYSTKDKAGKDTNFRGLTVFNNVVYMTKGSGSNGTNTVYFLDTTGSACPPAPKATYGVGVPAANATLPVLGQTYTMCVLNGFNTSAAKTDTTHFPFGIWFANANTLYLADEGSGSNTYDPASGTYTDAAASTTAGIQKWTFNGTIWSLAYTVQAGLNLGQPYTVPAYPTGTNDATGLPWAPATDGLRNISGHLNRDGTATIYATTSTVSGSGDQGADPNEVVALTDNVAATSAAAGESFKTIEAPQSRTIYRGVAVVPANYGS